MKKMNVIPKEKDNYSKNIFNYNKEFIQKIKQDALEKPKPNNNNIINNNIYSLTYSVESDLNSFYLKKLNNKFKLAEEEEDQQQQETNDQNNLERIFQIVSESFQLIQKDNYKLRKKKEILVEWKEVARRLDFVLFIIAFISITTTPIFLFGKFYFRDESINSSTCGCSSY